MVAEGRQAKNLLNKAPGKFCPPCPPDGRKNFPPLNFWPCQGMLLRVFLKYINNLRMKKPILPRNRNNMRLKCTVYTSVLFGNNRQLDWVTNETDTAYRLLLSFRAWRSPWKGKKKENVRSLLKNHGCLFSINFLSKCLPRSSVFYPLNQPLSITFQGATQLCSKTRCSLEYHEQNEKKHLTLPPSLCHHNHTLLLRLSSADLRWMKKRDRRKVLPTRIGIQASCKMQK